MLIKCTKKLLDMLEVGPSAGQQESSLFSWHANVVMVNRRKTVILLNDLNRYVIVLHGLKKKDFRDLEKLILKAICQIFEDECIDAEIIKAYMKQAEEITYTTTSDRSSTSRLNRIADWVHQFYDLLIDDKIIQAPLSMRISRMLVSDGKGDTPPEDVGGESGYKYFLGIMNDPEDEEHENFKLWAEEQRFRKYDPDFVKKAVERLFDRY
jgi:hypothetical protein